MRPKSLALLMLALGCGLVASIGITEWMKRRHSDENAPSGATRPVFVAAVDVPLGDILSPQMLKLEQWPADQVPIGAINKIQNVEGRRVRTRLYVGEVILENKLMGKGASQQGATAYIPKGYRAVPVRVDIQSGGSNLIQPGDRVDVMVYLTRNPSRGIAETVTRTILQDIKVFAVNDVLDLENEKDGARSINAKTISLLVTPEQAARVHLAQQLGTIQLLMRSPEDDSQGEVAEATPGELLGKVMKSERDKEDPGIANGPNTEKTSGWKNFLNTMRQKTQMAAAVKTKRPETWTVRIIQPNEVNDVTLQAEPAEAGANAPFGLWKALPTTPGQPARGAPPALPTSAEPVLPPNITPPAAPTVIEPQMPKAKEAAAKAAAAAMAAKVKELLEPEPAAPASKATAPSDDTMPASGETDEAPEQEPKAAPDSNAPAEQQDVVAKAPPA